MTCQYLLGCALAFIAWTGELSAQSWATISPKAAEEAHAACTKQYSDRSAFHMTVQVASYRDLTDKGPAEEVTCQLWRSGSLYKVEHFGFTSYQDGDLRVMIDPAERELYLSDGQAAFELVGADVQRELFAISTKAEMVDQGGEKHYRLHFAPHSQWSSVDFVIDPKGWMRHMTLTWGEPMAVDPDNPLSALVRPRIDFTFAVPEALNIPATELNWNKVLQFQGKEAQAIGAYKGYRVVDMRPR